MKTSHPCSGINISELGDTGWGATETGQGLPGRLKNELRHLQKPTLEPSAVTWTQEVTGWVERWVGRTWKELSFWNLKKTLFSPCGVDGGAGRRDITPLRSHQVSCMRSPRVAGSAAANIPRLSCCPCWRPFSVGLRSRGSNEGEPPCSRPSLLPTLNLQLPQPEATGQRQQWYLLSALYFLISKSKGRPGSTPDQQVTCHLSAYFLN